jgi:hypothetical protein
MAFDSALLVTVDSDDIEQPSGDRSPAIVEGKYAGLGVQQ